MASPSVTYTFSNSTTSDATQVNQNFTDIINGITDGTKDLSVNALTLAGNLSVSGNMTIGSASGDDMTVNASLASSIPVKTTATYDIGTSTLGLRAIYIGANAQTVNIVGSGSMSATWTFTLPVTAGTTGMFLKTNGSGASSWSFTETTLVKSTTWTVTAAETEILASTSGGSWTLTLPAAASFTNKHLYVKKTTSDNFVLTIDGNAAETIDGALTTTINLQYESILIVCDGSNWHILQRTIPPVAFMVYRTGNQTINDITATKVTFDTRDFDLYSFFDIVTSNRYVPLIKGKFNFHFMWQIAAAADQSQVRAMIYKNGSEIKRKGIRLSSAAAQSCDVSAVVDMNGTTDYIEFFVYHDVGSPQSLDATSSLSYCCGNLIQRGL